MPDLLFVFVESTGCFCELKNPSNIAPLIGSHRCYQLITFCPGIVSVSVGLMNERADVTFNPAMLSPEVIAAMVTDMGYTASVLPEESQHATAELLVRSIN